MKHTNSGHCEKCHDVIVKYPGFYEPLIEWFLDFQMKHPEGHVSCAGRGKAEQEALYLRGASRAQYGESAHNYNAALDFFEMTGDTRSIYEETWFAATLKPALPSWLKWYGEMDPLNPDDYYELPHVEVRDWKKLVSMGLLALVEPLDD